MSDNVKLSVSYVKLFKRLLYTETDTFMPLSTNKTKEKLVVHTMECFCSTVKRCHRAKKQKLAIYLTIFGLHSITTVQTQYMEHGMIRE